MFLRTPPTSSDHSSQSGISLIELMLVIGLVGTLGYFVVNKYRQFQKNRQRTTNIHLIMNNLIAFKNGLINYSGDWRKDPMPLYGRGPKGEISCTPPGLVKWLRMEIKDCTKNLFGIEYKTFASGKHKGFGVLIGYMPDLQYCEPVKPSVGVGAGTPLDWHECSNMQLFINRFFSEIPPGESALQ